MINMDHNKVPIISALIKYHNKKIISYDVPGHKKKSINTELKNLIGNKIYTYDMNSPIGLDSIIICNSVI